MLITDNVFMVGSAELSNLKDCCVYLVDLGELILIDTGCGEGHIQIVENIKSLSLSPENISTVILTHCHIDHIGGASQFKDEFGSKIIIHSEEAEPLKTGDIYKTGANLYGMDFLPVDINTELQGKEGALEFPEGEINFIHTPGHTPGSISLYIDLDDKRILFGQDIHGPFIEAFGSNIEEWKLSMEKLISLNADILCEGHFGIYNGKSQVKRYIEHFLKKNVLLPNKK